MTGVVEQSMGKAQSGACGTEVQRKRGIMGIRVLMADDSKTMRTIIRRSLQAVGVNEATEAGDGNEAIAKFKPGEFDLVLTDWNMPGQPGIEVARAIRAQDAKVPIIMITTEADKERVVQAVQAGVTDYLLKPFTPDALRDKLTKYGCG
jgi:two-component system, chemotaxis family, chemotaxis protein CheY